MKFPTWTFAELTIVAVCISSPVMISFSAGYAVCKYRQPEISKQERIQLMNMAIDSMAAVAKARAIADYTCNRCHGED